MVHLRVKEVAEAKGFNQSSLSRETEMSFITVKHLFQGEYRQAPVGVLERVAKALDVSIHDLIEELPDTAV